MNTKAGDWEQCTDEASGLMFYYNSKSGESQWEAPTGWGVLSSTSTSIAKDTKEQQKPLAERRGSNLKLSTEGTDTFSPTSTGTGIGISVPSTPAERGLKRQNSKLTDKHGDWEKCTDPESGLVFYYNAVTGVSQWEEPPGWGLGSTMTGSVGGFGASLRGPGTPSERGLKKENSKTTDKHGDWEKCTDQETGLLFYYNAVTGVSQWDPPSGWVDTQTFGASSMNIAAMASQAADLFVVIEKFGDWEKCLDKTSNVEFYRNLVTSESQWDAPAGWGVTRRASQALVNPYNGATVGGSIFKREGGGGPVNAVNPVAAGSTGAQVNPGRYNPSYKIGL